MRPMRILIEGLRSFRAPVSIDFGERNHIAVVGDTGAGKSSILEAMIYALYGKATFSGPNQELMNDTSTTLRVVLRFRVSGEDWEVARVVKRTGRGAMGSAQAQLVHLGADGETLEKLEQVRPVNERITELIGLDSDAFLRTVVLPQGRFARLLVEDKPTDRGRILRQVWRTDELEAMGAFAGAKLRDISQLRVRLEQAASEYPPDPERHLQTLGDMAAATFSEAQAATRTETEAQEARDKLSAAKESLRIAEGVAARVRPEQIDRLADQVAPIGATLEGIETQHERLRASEAGFRSALAGIPTDDGPGPETVAAALAGLEDIDSLAERAVSTAAELRAEIAAESESHRRARAAAEAEAHAAEQLERHSDLRPPLNDVAESARERVNAMERRYRECEDRHRGLSRARQKHTTLTKESTAVAARLNAARRDEDRARADATDAEAVLASARRTNSAAAAAHGLHAGDECPVCLRDLPHDWTEPGGSGLEEARRAWKAASAWAREAGEATAGLRARQQSLSQQTEACEHDVEEARGAVTLALGGLVPDAVYSPEAPLPELSALLSPLQGTMRGAAAKLAEHDRAQKDLASEASSMASAAAAARMASTAASQRVARARTTAGSALKDLNTKIRSIPSPFRPVVEMPADPVAIEGVDTAPVAVASGAAKDRQSVLRDRERLRESLRREIERTGAARAALVNRRTTEVDGPLRSIGEQLADHRLELRDAIRELACSVEMQRGAPAADPAALGRWMRSFRGTMDEVLRAADRRRKDASRSTVAARDALAAIAGRLRAPEHPEALAMLSERLGSSTPDLTAGDVDAIVRAARSVAETVRYTARRAAEARDDFAEILDDVLGLQALTQQVITLERALGDLDAALKPGAFLKWLTLRRSRELLVHASRMLGEMTGGKYAFVDPGDSEDQWRVLDQDSGQPRSPASLSGGEQFIGSLALALGMVEMMARSGGRLESLFLDEGFGSLDRNNLDAAVEALATVAARGRMVGVISHVRAVAEQIDDVLVVVRGTSGSQATWLSTAQRRRLSRSDVGWEASSALEGLLE